MNTAPAVDGTWIDVTGRDGTFQAWHCPPVNARIPGPGILLIQEIFGVNAHIRGVARQYAMDGFHVMAVDVFWREQPRIELGYDQDSFSQGRALAMKADFARCTQDLAATAKLLRGLPTCSGRVAAIGYCMGGQLAYRSAVDGCVDAAVAYYGGGIQTHLGDAPRIGIPVLFHYGAKDPHIPMSAVEAVRDAFRGHPDCAVHVYEDADHGFNCWARESYHQHAAALAHGRTLSFLAEHVSG